MLASACYSGKLRSSWSGLVLREYLLLTCHFPSHHAAPLMDPSAQSTLDQAGVDAEQMFRRTRGSCRCSANWMVFSTTGWFQSDLKVPGRIGSDGHLGGVSADHQRTRVSSGRRQSKHKRSPESKSKSRRWPSGSDPRRTSCDQRSKVGRTGHLCGSFSETLSLSLPVHAGNFPAVKKQSAKRYQN